MLKKLQVAEHSSKELINEIMSQKYMKDLVSGELFDQLIIMLTKNDNAI